MYRKLRYSRSYSDLYDRLWMGGTIEQKNRSDSFFKDKKDIFVICLILGFKNKVLVPLPSDSIPIDANYDEYKDILYSIAICHHKTTEILKKNHSINGYTLEKTLEELANGGAQILQEKLLKKGKGITENFEDLLENEITSERKVEETLDNIFR